MPVRRAHGAPAAIRVLQRYDASDEAWVDACALARQAEKRGGSEIDVVEHARILVDDRGDRRIHPFDKGVR